MDLLHRRLCGSDQPVGLRRSPRRRDPKLTDPMETAPQAQPAAIPDGSGPDALDASPRQRPVPWARSHA